MREIKFRAWDMRRKKIYEVCSLILNQYPKQIHAETWGYMWGKDCITRQYVQLHSENMIIMQYTGLKDKNDIEIYEGDIVSFLLKMGGCRSSRQKQKVDFDPVFGYQLPIDGKYLDLSGDSYVEEIRDVEVIGNIYEEER